MNTYYTLGKAVISMQKLTDFLKSFKIQVTLLKIIVIITIAY